MILNRLRKTVSSENRERRYTGNAELFREMAIHERFIPFPNQKGKLNTFKPVKRETNQMVCV